MSTASNFGLGAFDRADEHGMIDQLPCRICGQSTLSIREIFVKNQPWCWLYLCRPCQARTDEEMAPRRKIFDGLLADGVSSELANEMMIRWFAR